MKKAVLSTQEGRTIASQYGIELTPEIVKKLDEANMRDGQPCTKGNWAGPTGIIKAELYFRGLLQEEASIRRMEGLRHK